MKIVRTCCIFDTWLTLLLHRVEARMSQIDCSKTTLADGAPVTEGLGFSDQKAVILMKRSMMVVGLFMREPSDHLRPIGYA